MKSSKPLVTLMVVILLIVLLIASCGTQSAPIEDPGGEESPVESAGDESNQESGQEDIGSVYLTCPKEPIVYKLQFNHTFDFSPGRDTAKMLINGHTTPNAWCLVTLNGNVIEADDCLVDYEYSGYIQGSERCDVKGASTALISIEGECMDMKPTNNEKDLVAEIYLTITEGQDPDAGLSGTITCPGSSYAYIGFYPPTFSVMSFSIAENGVSDNDSGTDFSGQFEFNKSWTLIPAGFPSEP